MARPQKRTVEYFPHYVKSGRTIYILEAKYGNDGYSFWFKLLELLCDTDGQSYDCNNAANWEFLTAKTKVTTGKAREILNTLASLEAIDEELWKAHNLIWVQNLVDHLSPLYSKRNSELPQRPASNDNGNKDNGELSERKQEDNGITGAETHQSKVKESKVKESKGGIDEAPCFELQRIVDLWNAIVQTPKVARLTDDRKAKLKTRITEWGCTDQADMENKAREIFTKIADSDFLTGKDGKWKANFDWVFHNDRNYLKILEGNYDNRKSTQQTDPRLGVGEYITEDGRRTYGDGQITIPMDAQPRPGKIYSWNASGKNWIVQ